MKRNLSNLEKLYEYYRRRIYPRIKNFTTARKLNQLLKSMSGRTNFPGSKKYWENRYREGKTSGSGSYGKVVEFKAKKLNNFVEEKNIEEVIEFGCGDGNQLALAEYPNYIGLDVSKKAILKCKEKFQDDQYKSFFLYDPDCFVDNRNIFQANLTISLEVIFHLVEDDVFEKHIKHLFQSSNRYVIIYSSNGEISSNASHVKHRNFKKYIEKNLPKWNLVEKIKSKHPEKSHSNFYIYENKSRDS